MLGPRPLERRGWGRGRSRRARGRSGWDSGRRRLPGLRAVAVTLGVVVVLAAVVVGVQLVRSVPAPALQLSAVSSVTVPGASPALPWPRAGEATVGVEGIGIIGSSGGDSPRPIASLAKIMTAYLVLADHPLGPGQQGPSITVTPAVVAAYAFGAAQSQSVLRVVAGERLTELEALQALLIDSANNIAEALAAWDAGSTSAFVAKMNATARFLGLRNTHYDDPNGIAPTTVSDATDQVGLAELAMRNPVFASIVAEPSVNLPLVGEVFNYDYLVGHNGIVGIKTGSTTQAGGCFVFAAQRIVDGQPRVVIGAVIGQQAQGSILEAALAASLRLADAAPAVVHPVSLAGPVLHVGRVTAPWAPAVDLQAPGANLIGWPGLTVAVKVHADPIRVPLAAGQQVGTVTYTAGSQTVSVPVTAAGAVRAAPLSWRLRRL
jgi:D-alanyl-D-alanine carboxypeptidase (penicillin-binding protein 5/6)